MRRRMSVSAQTEGRSWRSLSDGRMSAESKDAFAVYQARQSVSGEKTQMGIDKEGLLQMKADTEEGKMAAESKDAEKVYKDQQNVKGEKKVILTDKSKLKADEQK